MTVTLFTRNGPAPRDEAVIRSTTNTVNNDAPPAMQESAPDYNNFTSDKREDGGLTPNTLASHVVPTEKYSPIQTNQNTDLYSINESLSAKGTAAAREMAGEYGHGTMKVVEGIEPVLVDGTRFDNVYFKANVGVVQGAAGEYMAASFVDTEVIGQVEQQRRKKAAEAANGPLYDAFLKWSQS